MPTLLKPMAQAFGWSRTQASAGIAVATLCLALGMPLVGRSVDRFGVRPVVITSTVLFSAMLYLFSRLPGSVALYVAMSAALGLAAVGASPLSYMTVLAKWFDARLGTAMGTAMLGMGLGYATVPLLAARWSQTMGWQSAFAALAAMSTLAVVNAWAFMREPRQTSTANKRLSLPDDVAGLTVTEALATRSFWLLAGAAFLVSVAMTGTGVHLVSLMSDRGYAFSDAAKAGSLLGVAVLSARLLSGFLLDRMPVTRIAAIAFLTGGAGILVLWSGAGGAAPFAAAFCMGVASGAEGDILPFACRRYFGLRAYGQLYGIIGSAFTLGAVVGPVVMGVAFDRGGGYGPMLLTFAVLCVLAAVASLALGRPRVAQQYDGRAHAASSLTATAESRQV